MCGRGGQQTGSKRLKCASRRHPTGQSRPVQTPRHQGDRAPIVADIVIEAAACHAGGRSSTRLGRDGADITAFSGRAKPLVLDLIADELDNQAELALAQQCLDCTDDPYRAVNGQPLTNSERLLSRLKWPVATTSLPRRSSLPHPEAQISMSE